MEYILESVPFFIYLFFFSFFRCNEGLLKFLYLRRICRAIQKRASEAKWRFTERITFI